MTYLLITFKQLSQIWTKSVLLVISSLLLINGIFTTCNIITKKRQIEYFFFLKGKVNVFMESFILLGSYNLCEAVQIYMLYFSRLSFV